MKAHKVELLVLDFENIGKDQIKHILENSKYIIPSVIDIETKDIGEWDDDNPLNYKDTKKEEYERIFKS